MKDFIDLVDITVESGSGGDGIVGWRREKFVPRGGPAGGDGGNGGSIILKATKSLNTLLQFKYKRNFKANNGDNGQQSRKSGKFGEDLIISVPVGTTIYRKMPTQTEYTLIGDLQKEGDSITVAQGGKGGRGNQHFATSTHQSPHFCEPGRAGKTYDIRLELKLLAHIGLIGLPNAGKSTLLSRLSAAKPKIADYPFTTLVPNLGILKLNDDFSLTLADIPGLISGASHGIGLGFNFLRHIQRTKALFHLIDLTQAEYGGIELLKENYSTIIQELEAFNPEILNKKEILIFTKTDSCLETLEPEIRDTFPEKDIFFISAVSGAGLEPLKQYLIDNLDLFLTEEENNPEFDSNTDQEESSTIQVFYNDELGVFQIESEYVEGLVRVTTFTKIESVNYLYLRLKQLGVLEKLESLNIQSGDTILVGDREMTWSEFADYNLI